jgi:hypothetical protein
MAKGKQKQGEEVAKSEEKAVSVQETKAVAEAIPSGADWGGSPISSNDIIIPRIMVMQAMSKRVVDGEATFGEFRESMNNEVLGKFDKGFRIVPFHLEKVFVEYDASEDDKKFLRVVPITPQNENLPYEDREERDGKKIEITRDRVMNFYVLRPEEIDLGGAIPYIVSFRRSSLKAGKKLATQMYVKNIASGKTPASVVCTVLANKTSNDKGTFAVMDIVMDSQTPDKYIAEAFKWLQLIKSGKAKAHEESYNVDACGEGGADVDLNKGPAKF